MLVKIRNYISITIHEKKKKFIPILQAFATFGWTRANIGPNLKRDKRDKSKNHFLLERHKPKMSSEEWRGRKKAEEKGAYRQREVA